MRLHNDKSAFEELVVAAAEELNIDSAIVEKDYYVSLALQTLVGKYSDIVFRGGTSLSKCYQAIERFSEDIDIAVDFSSRNLTESKKKNLKKAITETMQEMGFVIINLEETFSRRNYNKYIAKYDSIFPTFTGIKNELIIEPFVIAKPFPTIIKKVDNYVHLFLKTAGRIDLVEKYGLFPFEMKVQDIRRTFIDKVFAICDYFLSSQVEKHSRHIYDLYMLYHQISFDNSFKNLIEEVREARSGVSICVSAKPNCNIHSVLTDIMESDCYKNDYQLITEKIIFKDVPYEKAKEVLNDIISQNMF